jgi:hypothetical protein
MDALTTVNWVVPGSKAPFSSVEGQLGIEAIPKHFMSKQMQMRPVFTTTLGVLFVIVILYITLDYDWGGAFPPDYDHNLKMKNMEAHVITASALQETASLLTTLSLALTALFGFSVAKYLTVDRIDSYISIIGLFVFGICLTFVLVNAYGVYRNIIIQTDQGFFFPSTIEPKLETEAYWAVYCIILTVMAFCWRCFRD